MKRHTITIKDMDYLPETRLAASHSVAGENKTLDMFVNPAMNSILYVVRNVNKDVKQFTNITDAIEYYNSI